MKPKILVVEDIEDFQLQYRKNLNDIADILAATTLDEGKRLFDANPDIVLVVMDACVPGNKPNSMELVKHMRQTFEGPIIASSSMLEYREILIGAGCSIKSHKSGVPDLIRELLRLGHQ